MTGTDRAGYIAGLRTIAAALEDYPRLPLPYEGRAIELCIFAHTTKERYLWTDLITGLSTTQDGEPDAAFRTRIHGSVYGVKVVIFADPIGMFPSVTAIPEVTA